MSPDCHRLIKFGSRMSGRDSRRQASPRLRRTSCALRIRDTVKWYLSLTWRTVYQNGRCRTISMKKHTTCVPSSALLLFRVSSIRQNGLEIVGNDDVACERLVHQPVERDRSLVYILVPRSKAAFMNLVFFTAPASPPSMAAISRQERVVIDFITGLHQCLAGCQRCRLPRRPCRFCRRRRTSRSS